MTDIVTFANTPLGTVLIGALVTFAGWAYHKARGDKTASLRSTLTGVVDNAIHFVIVTAASRPDDIRDAALPYVWKGLLLVKVPRNAVTEAIVNELLGVAIADAIQAAKDHDRAVEVAIAANVATAKAEMAKPVPPAPVIPNIGDGIETTIVPRDGTEEYKPAFTTASAGTTVTPSIEVDITAASRGNS